MNQFQGDTAALRAFAGERQDTRLLRLQALFLLAADGSDMLLVERLVIDTVTIEPDENRVDLVWRALLPIDADLRVARLMQVTEAPQIARVDEMLEIQAALGRGAAAGTPAESAAQ
jgi:hypothetical protein